MDLEHLFASHAFFYHFRSGCFVPFFLSYIIFDTNSTVFTNFQTENKILIYMKRYNLKYNLFPTLYLSIRYLLCIEMIRARYLKFYPSSALPFEKFYRFFFFFFFYFYPLLYFFFVLAFLFYFHFTPFFPAVALIFGSHNSAKIMEVERKSYGYSVHPKIIRIQ